jgi:hypothetical protein
MAQKPVKKTAGKAPAKKAVAKKAATKPDVKPIAKPVVQAAVKPVAKKAPVKKAVAAKAAAKKTAAVKVAPIAAENVVATAPVEAPAAKGCGCGCGGKCCCGRFGRFVKKLVIFAIIFALGYATAEVWNPGHYFKGFRGPRVEFVNGCVDFARISCPEMAARSAQADTNGDGCVSKAEFRAAQKQMRKEFRAHKGGYPMHRGKECAGGCGASQPEVRE